MTDEALMRLAIEQAKKGVGRTHPNPAVGAVVARHGLVVGRGWHQKVGTPHAEVHALADAAEKAKGATLFCTLEPCNHMGRTPPCTEAILKAGIRRVVFGSIDPNPLVDGRGQRRLEAAGISVTAGVLASETDALNRPFFTAMRLKRPMVTAKAAVSLDGRLATKGGDSKWISSVESRQRAHALRDVVDAVVVGAGTVLADDPQLTTRLDSPARPVKNPARVVLDPRLRTLPTARVYKKGASRLVVTSVTKGLRLKALARLGVEVLGVRLTRRGVIDLHQLAAHALSQGWLHLLVEGGGITHSHFFRAGLVDEVCLFQAPKLIGADGLPWLALTGVSTVARAQALVVKHVERVGPDIFIRADMSAEAT